MNWHSLSKNAATPIELVIEGESALFLLHAISELPDDQATVVTRRYLEGYKLREIAEQMGFTVGKVAGLLRRGIESLKGKVPDSRL